jgi:hypothetical protein
LGLDRAFSVKKIIIIIILCIIAVVVKVYAAFGIFDFLCFCFFQKLTYFFTTNLYWSFFFNRVLDSIKKIKINKISLHTHIYLFFKKQKKTIFTQNLLPFHSLNIQQFQKIL